MTSRAKPAVSPLAKRQGERLTWHSLSVPLKSYASVQRCKCRLSAKSAPQRCKRVFRPNQPQSGTNANRLQKGCKKLIKYRYILCFRFFYPHNFETTVWLVQYSWVQQTWKFLILCDRHKIYDKKLATHHVLRAQLSERDRQAQVQGSQLSD
eukprot:g1515.t1